MSALCSMRAALDDPGVLGGLIDGPSWLHWRAVLIASQGEALTDEERTAFTEATGRETEPHVRSDELIAVCGRRSGKSRATSVLSAYTASCVDHSDSLISGETGILAVMSATTRQAEVIFKYLSAIFHEKPLLKAMVLSETADTIRLSNNVDIEVRPASYKSIRGMTLIGCVADEACFWNSELSADADQQIFAAVRPGLASTNGQLVAISSPYARRGEVWAAYRDHFGPNGDVKILVANGASRTFNPTLSEAVVARAFERDPQAASAEFGGRFRDDLEAFLNISDVAAVTDVGVKIRHPARHSYVGAVDMAGGSGGGDSATLAVAHREGDVAVLDCLIEKTPPFDAEAVTVEFAAVLKRYGVAKATGDRWGSTFVQEAFRRNGVRLEHSEKVRSDLYLALLPMITSRQVRLLDEPKMASQFVNLERRVGRSGKDSVNHPPGRNSHDDCCNVAALALTLAGLGKLQLTPEQVFRIQRQVSGIMQR